MASSSSCPQWKYHVFLSFRGEDTRYTFTSHLHKELTNKGIHTFLDDKELEGGDSIPKKLPKAIEESQVAFIIFSKNYATSSWCLSELVKIMECKKKNGQIVVPIFYDVDPSHVRHQSEGFAEAFAKHESKFKDDVEGMQKVQAWRTALTAVADLTGHDIHNKNEAERIQHIVGQVLSKLGKASVSFLPNVVGINTHLEKLNSLLEMEVNDVRIVGIWGMGGVGKTTIARAIFDKNKNQFDGTYFFADIKENKGGVHSLQNILFSKLLGEDEEKVEKMERSMIADRLCRMKVLVVLDDIDNHDHLEYLAGDVGWFGNGSRIIVTTRDKKIIGKKNAVYEVTTLLEHDAIQLFNQYAFKDETPDEHMKKLALEVVSHAKGLPLALKLWGIMLHNQETTMWTEVVGMIKRESSPDIVKKLKISFEGLQDEEKTIFLDIACFFRGEDKYETIEILQSYDVDVGIRLRNLIEKSLVFISKYDEIQMHDLIQDMGRYVVKMQKKSGKPTRLWKVEDFKDVMVNNTTTAVEAIWIYCQEKLWFSKEAMKNMQRLRILCIQNFGFESQGKNDGSIDYLSNNLRWFVWHYYPRKSLPQNFNPTRLVHLDLSDSSLHHLWNETKPQLLFLRRLNLSSSKSLERTPDFTGMPNLEYLDLSECDSLKEVHLSLRYSRKLIGLNLDECRSLEKFPYVNVECLEYLCLENCSSLEKFPEIHGIMKPELVITMLPSQIREIPSIVLLQWAHLTELDLSGMYNLVSLPSSICKLKDLVSLDVSFCSKLKSLPEGIEDLEKLEELHAPCTRISRPPSSIIRLNKLKILTFAKEEPEDRVYFVFPQVNGGLHSLEELDLSYCNLIDGGVPKDIGSLSSLKILNLGGCNLVGGGLPEDIGCLSSLEELNLGGNNFEHLPRSIAQLGALRVLDISHCDKMKELPGFTGMTNLDTLNLSYCNLIDGGLPKDIGSLSSLKNLNLCGCNLIDGGLPEDIGCLSSLKVLSLCGNNFEHLPRSIAQLSALRSLDLSHCERLTQLPEIPQQLSRINADWSNDWICNSLFQNISSLQHDISASYSLPLRVFTSWWLHKNIPSWFHHQGMDTVNLPENWYVPDNFLGFAICCIDSLISDITVHLIPLCDDGMSSMTQKFDLSDHLGFDIYFLLVPLAGLWDASKANGKTPNDYRCFRLCFSRQPFGCGVRLLYKDGDEVQIGMRRSRDEEGSCSSNKKQRSLLQLFPTSPGL